MGAQDRPPDDDARLPVQAAVPPAGRGASAVEAHLLSQAERRRGLRAGPQQVETAASAYCEREWSGDADRRRPPGGVTRKKI